MELRCALDGAVNELSRGRPASEAAELAESQTSEEENEDVEDGRRAIPSTAEVLVLDSDGELENVEEAFVAPKQEEGIPATGLESAGGEVNATAEEEGEEVRVAVSELEYLIAQFSPREEEEDVARADRAAAAASAVTEAVVGATTQTPASTPIAIALVSSRCLHAHLATPAAALASLVSSSSSRISLSRGAEVVEATRKSKGEEEGRGEEEFLRSLEERCGVREDEGGGRVVGGGGGGGRALPEAGRVSDRAEGCARKQQQQEQQEGGGGGKEGGGGGGERSVMAHHAESRCLENELKASEQPPTSGGGGGDPPASLASGAELPPAFAMEAGGSRTEGKYAGRVGRKEGEMPEFLLQLEAGWVLASVVWEGVTLLERARDYDRAVELLSQLLATRWV